MTVQQTSENVIKIRLNLYETVMLFGKPLITDTVNFKNVEIFKKILANHNKSDFLNRYNKLKIRVIQDFAGGWIITVTGTGSVKFKKVKTPKRAYAMEFAKSEDMLECIAALYKCESTRNLKSELYFYAHKYILIVFAEIGQTAYIKHIFEYAVRIFASNITLAVICEHGQKIAGPTAIKQMGPHFIKDF